MIKQETQSPLLSINDLQVHFPIKGKLLKHQNSVIRAVDGVNLQIRSGETLGLVGESGCGKTTIGRAIVRLNQATAGEIIYKGETDILKLKGEELRQFRRKLQIIFQDPYSSLNPRQSVKRILSEVMTVQMKMSEAEAAEEVKKLLLQVGLSPVYASRYPHEFSGGQRQRIAIARSIIMQPEFLVCDEAVSALDVSIQSQIINLLMDLKEKYKDMTLLFISHALNVVEHISDRVAVMYLGKIVELANTDELFRHPQHPYTLALFSAIPLISGQSQRERIILKGEVPSAANIPSGCRFRTRCPKACEKCSTEVPELREIAPDHWAACHFV